MKRFGRDAMNARLCFLRPIAYALRVRALRTILTDFTSIFGKGIKHNGPRYRKHTETTLLLIIIIIITVIRFYIALFSALEQTHCAHVACDSE